MSHPTGPHGEQSAASVPEVPDNQPRGYVIGHCGHRRTLWTSGYVDRCACDHDATRAGASGVRNRGRSPHGRSDFRILDGPSGGRVWHESLGKTVDQICTSNRNKVIPHASAQFPDWTALRAADSRRTGRPACFDQLCTAVEEIGRLHWLLHQVVMLADDAPGLADEELRDRGWPRWPTAPGTAALRPSPDPRSVTSSVMA